MNEVTGGELYLQCVVKGEQGDILLAATRCGLPRSVWWFAYFRGALRDKPDEQSKPGE
ncbi:hypothetical protein [Dickeya undicola]|uniref:hypothetical protein n=1 Tax=Dickeya undicola TaxID=1577887 RepID=UPI003F69E653